MEITVKQEAFCLAYVASRDIKDSAIKAGYSKNYAEKKAYSLLKKETIKKRIAQLEQDFFSSRFATLAIASMGVLEEIILENYEDKTRLSAIKEVFKYYALERKMGLDENREDVEHTAPISIVFNEVPSRKREEYELQPDDTV